jgi:tRNA dimethylallyltransferase
MAAQKRTLIVVTGPTGVGKTEMCLALAEHFHTDIINADSRQIYVEIPIGTAAPSAQQMQRVRHHFVGTKHIGDYYSASLYEEDVMRLFHELDTTLPPTTPLLMTGGSMMYIDAVCNGIDDLPTIRDDIRQLMKQRLADEGLQSLTDELKRLDPEHWEKVDRNNPRRVVHALEICHQTGKTYTSFRTGTKKERPFNIVKTALNLPREELYERINNRVLKMVDDGLIDEARRMLPFRQENALNTVGYKEMFKYFDGDIPLDEAIRQIQSNTRQYARKQLTWYKKDTDVEWFMPTDIEGIIKHLKSTL